MMQRQLQSKMLFEVRVELNPPQEVGNTPHGTRIIWGIAGGRIKGQRVSGELLPGGSDWALLRSDGVVNLDIRATIRTDDGHLICMCPRGLVNISPDLHRKLREGQPVDPSEYYFRTACFFETSSEKYSWLNKIIAVGVLERTATGVTGIVYEVV